MLLPIHFPVVIPNCRVCFSYGPIELPGKLFYLLDVLPVIADSEPHLWGSIFLFERLLCLGVVWKQLPPPSVIDNAIVIRECKPKDGRRLTNPDTREGYKYFSTKLKQFFCCDGWVIVEGDTSNFRNSCNEKVISVPFYTVVLASEFPPGYFNEKFSSQSHTPFFQFCYTSFEIFCFFVYVRITVFFECFSLHVLETPLLLVKLIC